MNHDNTISVVEKQENETDIVCSSKSLTEFEDQEELQESANSTVEGLEHLSKRCLRKLKKHETWLARLPEKRAKEKLKKKQRRQDARERGETLGPTRKMLKLNSMEKSACKVKVVLDCSFDRYMGNRDIMKLTKQVGFCYSANRRAPNPLQFYVCGLHGQMKERLESIGDYKNWDVNFMENDYYEEFDKEKITYLTSDSPNVLDDLSDDHAYIIGGLVDHNHHRGLCYQMAEERGLSHAQLPIGQYITMKSRKVLTVNHVFEVLLKYTETKDWKKSFFSIIPQRKVEKEVLGYNKDIVEKDCSGTEETDLKHCSKTETNSSLEDLTVSNEIDSSIKSNTSEGKPTINNITDVSVKTTSENEHESDTGTSSKTSTEIIDTCSNIKDDTNS